MNEFVWTLNEVEKIAPKNILEIGIYKGGTLQYWWELVKNGGLLIGIDPSPQPEFYNKFLHMPANLYILKDYSNNDDTIETVETLLNGEKLDFIHIDGDHSIPHVDYRNYINLLRDGGMISFHDVISYETGPFVYKIIKDNGWDSAWNFEAYDGNHMSNHGVAVMWKQKTGRFDIIGDRFPEWFENEQRNTKSNI
jgi:predicted O-methyltransferase YrrM